MEVAPYRQMFNWHLCPTVVIWREYGVYCWYTNMRSLSTELLLLIRANPERRTRCGELDRPTYSCLPYRRRMNPTANAPFEKRCSRSIGSEFSLSEALISYHPWIVRGT